MTNAQIKEILERVLQWPPERQADVAHMVQIMEEQDKTELRLSEDQAEEVRHRLSQPAGERIAAEDVFSRFRPGK